MFLSASTLFSIEWWGMVAGGLGLFLIGITFLGDTLKKIAGDKLRTIINKYTTNPFKGLLVGIGFTAIIQSSSGTTALAIGFVRAGLMSFPQAVAIIMGANIGTTVTAFLISLNISAYAPFVILVGAFMILLISKQKFKDIGMLMFSLGALFFGLTLMDGSLKLLTKLEGFADFLTSLGSKPLLGLLIGIVFTAVIQSSSAVIGILQSIYALSITSGANINISAVLPILFGSNIGTCVTAVLASLGGSVAAKRSATVHIFFNIFGSVLFMILLTPFSSLMMSAFGDLSPKMQLALSHIVFNIATTLLLFPFINQLVALVRKIIPGKEQTHLEIKIQELDHSTIKNLPSAGLDIAKNLSIKMGAFGLRMLAEIENYIKTKNDESYENVLDLEKAIDKIDRQLTEYLLSADQGVLTERDLHRYGQIMRGIKDIERIGDYCENLIVILKKSNEKKEEFGETTKEELLDLIKQTRELLSTTIKAFTKEDPEKVKVINDRRKSIEKHIEYCKESHILRVTSNIEDGRTYISLVYVDILSAIERICSHCSNIAKLYKSSPKKRTIIELQISN